MEKEETMTISGMFDGTGRLLITNKVELERFGKQWPGSRVVLELSVFVKGSTGSQLGYYRKKIVPDIRKGLMNVGERMSENQVDELLRRQSPACTVRDPEHGEVVVPVESLPYTKMSQHIDWCVEFAATNLGVNIEKSRRL